MNEYKDRGNMKWNASAFMLPQHIQRIQKWYREEAKRPRPQFDEQHVQELEWAIKEAQHEQYTAVVRVFTDYEDIVITGHVTKMNPETMRLYMDTDDGPNSASIFDIIDFNKAG